MECKFLPGDRLVVIDVSPARAVPGPLPFKLRDIVTCEEVIIMESGRAGVHLKEYNYLTRYGVRARFRHGRFEKLVDLSQFHEMCHSVPKERRTKEPA